MFVCVCVCVCLKEKEREQPRVGEIEKQADKQKDKRLCSYVRELEAERRRQREAGRDM